MTKKKKRDTSQGETEKRMDHKEDATKRPSIPKLLYGRYRRWRQYVSDEWDRSVEEQGTTLMLVKLFLPIGIMASVLYLASLSDKIPGHNALGLFALYLFTPAGMEAGVTYGILDLGIWPPYVVSLILVTDCLVAMFLIWNIGYARLVPFFGPLLKRSEEGGKKTLEKYPWVSRSRFIGLVSFVLLPLWGTGSILGSLVGRIIGLESWRIFLAIMTGSVIRSTMLATVTVYSSTFPVFQGKYGTYYLILFMIALVICINIALFSINKYRIKKEEKEEDSDITQ